MHNEQTLGGRLKLAREALGYTQTGVADAVGCGFRTWQDYEAGKRRPSTGVITELVKRGINANWLLEGSGPMLYETSDAQKAGEMMVRDVLEGDEEARKYRENQEGSLRSVMRAANQALQDAEAEVGYTPPVEVKTTIQELLIGGHLTARGAAILLQRLRTTLKQEDSE